MRKPLLFLLICVSLYANAQPNLLKSECMVVGTITSNQVFNNGPTTYTYQKNAQGLVTVKIMYQKFANEVIPRNSYVYTYDSQGNKLSEFYRTYRSSSKDWFNQYKYEWTYAPNSKSVLTFTSYVFNYVQKGSSPTVQALAAGKDSMYADRKRINKYDALGNLLESMTQTLNDQKALFDSEQILNKYNLAGKRIESVTLAYDNTLKKMVNATMDVNTYNPKGARTSQITKKWVNGKWTDIEKYEWSTNSIDSVEFRHIYEYRSAELKNLKKPGDAPGWKKTSTDQFFYDAKGKNAGNVTMTLNPVSDTLAVTEQQQFQIDDYGNILAQLTNRGAFDDKGTLVPTLTEQKQWVYNSGGDEVTITTLTASKYQGAVIQETNRCTQLYDAVKRKGPTQSSLKK